jgi:hypothetical protein
MILVIGEIHEPMNLRWTWRVYGLRYCGRDYMYIDALVSIHAAKGV